MLPTLLFILGVYGTYALGTVWIRRSRRRPRDGRQSLGASRLLLGGSIIAACCLLWLAVRLAPPSSRQFLNFSGVLGVTEAKMVLARAEIMPEKPPVASATPGDHPAYALLHPETPPMLMPEKTASPPSPPRKPKMKQRVTVEASKGKVSGKPAGTQKPAPKAKDAKKRPPSAKPASLRQAYSAVMR